MATLEALNGRFRIGTRIAAGFALVLALMLGLGGSSWLSLDDIKSLFGRYSTISSAAKHVGDVEVEFGALRRAALVYATTGDAAAQATIATLDATIRKNLDTAIAMIVSEERRSLARAIQADYTTYLANVARITPLRTERTAAVDQGMNVIGLAARREITAATERAMAVGDFQTAAHLGRAQEGLGLARINALRYLAAPNQDQIVAADEAFALMNASLERARTTAQPESRALIETARTTAASYMPAFRTAAQTIAALDELVNRTNAAVAQKLGEDIEALLEKQGAALAEIKAAVEDDIASSVREAAILSALAVVIALLASLVVSRGITRPVGAMTQAMKKLADGDLTVEVPAKENRDEIGDMAKTVQVFKENALKVKALEEEQRRAEERAEAEKKAALAALADGFERQVGGVVSAVSASAVDLQGAAEQMSGTAEETSRQATAVAAASEQASTNVQTVAAAAEELASSIAEISRQVAESARITGQAVDDVARTGSTVEALATAAQKIGDVVKLISDIASQTNLLALNATIEAARAGDAGKGFAVVASEVKSLASQTARATEEIGSQIAAIQNATSESVDAMRGIGTTIGKMNEIAAGIASAVEEQGAATAEIARNVQQAAAGTNDVSSNIAGVTTAAADTGKSAENLQRSAGTLGQQATTLKSAVAGFLAEVRAA
jgi:methyl-accepting chemotaxis protein